MSNNTFLRNKKTRIAFILALTLLLQVFMPIMIVQAASYTVYQDANYSTGTYNLHRILSPGDTYTIAQYNQNGTTHGKTGYSFYIDGVVALDTGSNEVESLTYTVPSGKYYEIDSFWDGFSQNNTYTTPWWCYLSTLYKVNFDYNGGSDSPTISLIKNGDNYSNLVENGKGRYNNSNMTGLPTPTRDGYTFAGWYTEQTDGTLVTNDTEFNNNSFDDLDNITLYAHWSRYSSYTVNDNLTYNGTEQTGITFDIDTVTCVGGTYKATDAGTYTATLTPNGDYTWSDGGIESKEVTWTISPGTIPDETIKFEDNVVTYDEREHSITVTGELSGGTVEYSLDNTSWSSTLPKFTDAGVYQIYYKASKTNYEKSGTATLTINKKPITPEITIDKTEFTYNGSVQQPVVSVKVNNTNIPAAEFKAVYTSDSTNVGNNKSVTVSSSNHNYTFDSVVLNYVINPKAIDGSMVTIENPEYVYDNTNKTPVVTLKDGANTLAVNTDYEILGTTTAKERGHYNIIVEGKGNYTDQYTIPWAIVPDAPPVISGATNGASYGVGTTINLSVSDISGLASVTINGESKPVTGNTYTQTISGAGSYTITATDTAGNTSTLSFTIKSGGSGGSGGSSDSGGSGGSGGGSSGGGGSNNPSGNTPSSDNGNKPTDNIVPNNNPDNNQPSDTARNNKKTSDSKSNNQTSNNGQDDESIDDKDSEGSTTNDKEDVTTNVTNDDFNRIFFNEERTISYGDGKVIVSVDVEDEGGTKTDYSGSIVGDAESIVKAVLSQDDIDAVANGETVWIKLVVTLISEDVPQTDKEQIEAALTTIADQELIPGTYYDLKVVKSIGGGDWEKLTTLNDDIEITLDIDKDLQAEGRTFYILRSHEGAVTMLFDLDEEPDTITISSRYFSTYALVYTDSPDVAEPVSEKHNCFMHWFILAAALIGEILALLLRRHEDKKKLLIGTECVDIVIMLALAIIGSCMWDWIIFAIGTAAIVLTVFLPHES